MLSSSRSRTKKSLMSIALHMAAYLSGRLPSIRPLVNP